MRMACCNLRGWQWVFLMTALPAIIMGVVTFFILPSGPEQAKFLTAEDKAHLRDDPGSRERREAGAKSHVGVLQGPDATDGCC